MRAPAFWSRPADDPGLTARLLTPLSWLWRLGGLARGVLRRPVRAPVPVICVGNATAGGTGKTPIAIALARRLSEAGHSVHIVSRGHGGRRRGPHRVDIATDTAADVGDEALLLATAAPTWVARRREAGAMAAAEAGAEIVLLDDGAQYPGLAKNLTILVIDAVAGIGNARLIPAGPLREPLEAAAARAGVLVLMGDRHRARAFLVAHPEISHLPCTTGRLAPIAQGMSLEGLPVVAFAGIGRPEKAFATIQGLGARLVAAHPFPDHHSYPEAVLKRLIGEARRANALLVTTEKDAARLPAWARREVMVVMVRFEPEDWAPIDRAVAAVLSASGRDQPSVAKPEPGAR